jgi:hypothetical protein
MCRCRWVSCTERSLPLIRRTPSLLGVVLVVVLAACSSSSATSPRLVAQTSGRASRPTSAAHSPHVRAVKPTATTSPSSTTARRRTYPNIPGADLPRHALTLGIALAVSRARVCTSGYASGARDVSDAEKAAVYARYGVAWVPYAHEVDHLVSLELGGSNVIRNLWPEPYAGRWGARTKDVLENRLHDLVCEGRLALRSAQRQEARDWVAAYRKYIGSPPAAGGSAGSSPGGFYASSNPTASTIYCADDSAWHELSRAYLVHFATSPKRRRVSPAITYTNRAEPGCDLGHGDGRGRGGRSCR